ncbi:MAG: 4Fe-4S binding protein [Candidatus Aceula lacicola]|nr:4Fe-4S binding protein [Candidatus Aceula lacicola]
MKTTSWLSQISFKQQIWLLTTVVGMFAVISFGVLSNSPSELEKTANFNINMSIQDIAPKLEVTGKALARELDLQLDAPKKKSLSSMGITEETLQHSVEHLLSHRDSMLKYYVYIALFAWGLVFLVRLGRPDGSDIKNRHDWYPRTPYIISLLLSVAIAGFLLGKSPNPMESIVKVFKSMIGLYPDPMVKIVAFVFFIILAIVGNKIICGWACPFGALQELIYSMPILRKIKEKKLPFVLTNTIRACLFITTFLFLFGIIGGRKGFVIYHYVNPFNLFNLDFETLSLLLTVIITLLVSLVFYRPFCQLICPFGLISWIAEKFSIFRVKIDKEKCTQCGACIKACPLKAAEDRVKGKKMPADCFSCARCLNVCPVDAIRYTFFLKKNIK